MGNLVVFYDKNKDILKIVSKYKEMYQASVYEIETTSNVNIFTKLKGENVSIKRCPLNIKNYENIILISSLWFNKIPTPVIRFLEQIAGNINNIIYVLYNENKKDVPEEFDKMDKIINLRRDKSYFVSMDKKEIHVRVYQ